MKRYILLLSLLLLYGCSNPAEPKDYRWKMGDDDTPTEVILPPPCIPTVICKPMWHTQYEAAYKCSSTDPCSGQQTHWVALRDVMTDACTCVNLYNSERFDCSCPYN